MRTMKPITNDELLHDRFDTVFRTGKLEPRSDVYDSRVNRHKKTYKFYNKAGEYVKEFAEENQKLKD